MKLQTDDHMWINTRFILNYYLDNMWIMVKMVNGDLHHIYHDVNLDCVTFEKLVRFVSMKKLTTPAMSKEELYNYMKY